MQAALAPEPVRGRAAPQPPRGPRAARFPAAARRSGCSASSATAGSRPAWPAACSSTRRRRPRRSRSRSAFAVLLVPYSTLGPFVGVFLDRWSRRTSLVTGQPDPGRPGAAGGGVRLVRRRRARCSSSPPSVSSRCNRFFLAGLSASLPHVVDEERLVTANSFATTVGTVIYAVGLVSAATVFAPHRHRLASVRAWSRPRRRSAYAASAGLISGSFRSRRPRAGPCRRTGSVARRAAADGPGHGRRVPPPGPAAGRRQLMTVQAVHRGLYGVLALTTLLLYRNFYCRGQHGRLTDRPVAGGGGRRGRGAAGGGAHAAG